MRDPTSNKRLRMPKDQYPRVSYDLHMHAMHVHTDSHTCTTYTHTKIKKNEQINASLAALVTVSLAHVGRV